MTNAWVMLVLAGFCEIAWALGLKYSNSFSRFWPSVGTIAMMVASVVLLAGALRQIPVGTGYTVWTGIGAVGTALFGMLLFDESRDAIRLLFIAMIVAGIVGLKLVSTE